MVGVRRSNFITMNTKVCLPTVTQDGNRILETRFIQARSKQTHHSSGYSLFLIVLPLPPYMQISVQADYVITFDLEVYSNPRFLLANGRCCSDSNLTSNCPSPCSDRLRLCVISIDDPSGLNPLFCTSRLNAGPMLLFLPAIEGSWPLVKAVI